MADLGVLAPLGVLEAVSPPSPVASTGERKGSILALSKPLRRRGRPKGSRKTGGRKSGTPNKSTQQLRALIHRRGKPVQVVCRVAAGKEVIAGLTQADALKLLFKAVVPELKGEVISGPDDGPLQTETTIVDTVDKHELAKRIVWLLSKADICL